MTTVAGSGQYGYADSNVATAAQMRYPTGITGSPDGTNLFITDNQNDIIRKVLFLHHIALSVSSSHHNPRCVSSRCPAVP